MRLCETVHVVQIGWIGHQLGDRSCGVRGLARGHQIYWQHFQIPPLHAASTFKADTEVTEVINFFLQESSLKG
jgi:hypothetical protein